MNDETQLAANTINRLGGIGFEDGIPEGFEVRTLHYLARKVGS